MVYLRGLHSVVAHLRKTKDIAPLLVGTVSYEHLDVLEELRWRDLLRPARYRPEVFETDPLAPIIDALAQGGGLVYTARTAMS